MKFGVVQQVGTPLEVYNLPSNDFVAGFLGSPAMNFVPCQVQQEGDNVVVTAEGVRWVLPLGSDSATADRVAKNRARLQGKLILGIRPEDLSLVTAAPDNPASTSCRITLVEHMGATNIFIVQVGAQQITISTPADFYLPPGSNAAILMNSAKVHFFEASSGRNLTL